MVSFSPVVGVLLEFFGLYVFHPMRTGNTYVCTLIDGLGHLSIPEVT